MLGTIDVIGTLRTVVRSLAFLILTFFIVPVLFLASLLTAIKLLPGSARDGLIRQWHKGCMVIFGVKVRVFGEQCTDTCLFVANHVSYLDIFAIGSYISGSFIAKKEVRSWPLLGWLSTLQQTIFVDRESRDINTQINAIKNPLSNQRSVILFPEGTSTDGKDVIRFKSSLFALTDHFPVLKIQPISLKFYDHNGKELDDETRDCYAYYGDIIFGHHFLKMASSRGARIDIHIHPAVTTDDFANQSSIRKAVTQHCYQVIKQTVTDPKI